MLRIFLPQKLLSSTDNILLFGWHNCHETIPCRSVFIWAAAAGVYEFNRRQHDPKHTIIGKLDIKDDIDSQKPNLSRGELFLHMKVANDASVVVTKVLIGKNKPIAAHSCTIILFNPEEFNYLNELVLEIHNACCKNVVGFCDDICLLHSSLKEFRESSEISKNLPIMKDFSVQINSTSNKLCQLLFMNVITIIIFLSGFVNNLVSVSGLQRIIETTSKYLNFSLQLKTRLSQLTYLQSSSLRSSSDLRCWNTASAVSVDVILGILLTCILVKLVSADVLLDEFLIWTNLIVDNLHSLLNWLMGVPAGLKLNYALNYSMGTFFLFHIYLWQAYLYVMKPALELMLNISMYCGVFGLSCQLCVIQDLLSFATFHIYCFYAYAARIFNINLVSLVSYWRVFRGKKWNPLRQRIDSCLYDVDQLFIGTLCFTIFLFLLPTALMYYFVFLILRLNVLILQGIVQKIIALVNSFPLCTLALFFLNSKVLVANFSFSVMPTKDMDMPAVILLNSGLCSLGTAARGFSPPVDTNERQTTWKTFLADILTGRLIYPI